MLTSRIKELAIMPGSYRFATDYRNYYCDHSAYTLLNDSFYDLINCGYLVCDLSTDEVCPVIGYGFVCNL